MRSDTEIKAMFAKIRGLSLEEVENTYDRISSEEEVRAILNELLAIPETRRTWHAQGLIKALRWILGEIDDAELDQWRAENKASKSLQ